MSTPNPVAEFPPPIVNDVYLPASSGETERTHPESGSRLNLVTGEYRVAHLIRGILYDTERSTLVASVTSIDAANGLNLRRLYRTEAGHWFAVHCNWWHRLFVSSDEFLWPLPDEVVLSIAMSLVPDKDCPRFLRDWYEAGLIPRDDTLAKAWAEQALSGDDLEAARASLARLPAASRGDDR